MADLRKNIECDYCGTHFHIKYPDTNAEPGFCCFCGEGFDDPESEVEDEDDDGDLDYCDDDRDETEEFN